MTFEHIKINKNEINQRLDNLIKKYIEKNKIKTIYKKIRKKKYL